MDANTIGILTLVVAIGGQVITVAVLWGKLQANQTQGHKEREELKTNQQEQTKEIKELRIAHEQRISVLETDTALLNQQVQADNSRHDQMLFFAKEFADKMAQGFKEAIQSLKS